MTDRIHSFQVILDKDIRDDDIEGIISAIVHVKGVLNVLPRVADFNSQMAEERARRDLKTRLATFLREL